MKMRKDIKALSLMIKKAIREFIVICPKGEEGELPLYIACCISGDIEFNKHGKEAVIKLLRIKPVNKEDK